MKTRRMAERGQHSMQAKSVPKRHKLNIRTKLDVIARLRAGESAAAIAKDCKMKESTIRYIRKNLKLIVRKGESLGFTVPETAAGKPSDPCQLKMEQLLKEWIELHKVSLAHRQLIREKAQVFYRLIRKENHMEEKECELVHSGHWYKSFKNRFLRDKMKEVNSVARNMRSTTGESKTVSKKPKRKLKPKRIFLALSDKLDIVYKLEEGQDPMELARSYNVCLTTIRRVSRRADEIKKQCKRTPQTETPNTEMVSAHTRQRSAEKRQNVDEDTDCLNRMEVLLKAWISKHKISLDVEDVILRKAGALYDLIRDENELDIRDFDPGKEWLRGFKDRFEEIEQDNNELEIFNLECDKTVRFEFNTRRRHNTAHNYPYFKELQGLFGGTLVSVKTEPYEPVTRKTSKYEHYKTKRHNSIKGNLRREGEFYYELEDLFDDDSYESITSYDDPLDYMESDEKPFYYAASSQERLQANNKPQSSPTITTPISQTRQEKAATPQSNDVERDPDEVCLRWNSHHSNMKTSFPTLLEKEQYVDVTLCSEGQTIRCHRLILSSCSSYFDEILSGITPLQHPVIFLKGTPFWILKSLIDFMYVGEVHIEQAKLAEILEVAELLKIKGLTGKSTKSTPREESTPIKKEKVSTPAPQLMKPQIIHSATPSPARSITPLKFVTKEQAANMQIVDPLSLLKPTYYEEQTTGTKKLLIPIRPKPQSLAEFSAKQKEWLSKKITPKKKLKRKSTEHEPSPPPIILRKGTKSRPIVKAPKYYHMEYEQKKENMQNKEDDTDDSDSNRPPQPKMIVTAGSTSAIQLTEPTFDLANVKSEPLEMDIEENFIDDYDENDSMPHTVTPLIQITEPRTVAADESNIFVSNPNSPEPPQENENDKNPDETDKEEAILHDDEYNATVEENDTEKVEESTAEKVVEENEADPVPEAECPEKELGEIDPSEVKSDG